MELPNYRASEAHYLYARGRTKTPQLTEGAKTWLQEVWLRENCGIRPEVHSKQMWKGREVEDEAIRIYCKYYNDGKPIFKNQERLTEKQLTGECDARNREQNRIIEIKNSYNPLSFIKADRKREYAAQVQVYMHLWDADQAHLAYCLLDLPDWLYQDELRRYCYQAQILDPEHPDHKEELEAHRRQFIYSDNPKMPEVSRIKVYVFERDPDFMERILEGVELANDYYSKLTLDMLHQ